MASVSIVTLGCPKNAIDSEGLAGLLRAEGHELVEDVRAADVAVVNTCGFIDAARRETIEEVLDIAELKQDRLKALVMTGCLVARSAAELADALPEVDALVDFAAYPRVGRIVTDAAGGTLTERVHGRPGTRFDPAYWDATIAAAPRIRFGRKPWAYLKIAEGCDRGCTFCAIPLMRGKLRSRTMDEIVDEARRLAASGASELSLVSQDSVMWGRDRGASRLLGLLGALERVEGIERLRLMYLHPQGVDERLIEKIAASERIVSYFDLSLQHVSPPVLSAMGRWGGAERFHSMIHRIRSADESAAVRATFIVGFPGESEDDAAAVEEFVADAGLDWVGVFTYSREEGTRSALLPEQVPAEVARERAERVSGLADRVMAERARMFVGRELTVLTERLDLESGDWYGRSHREAPEVDGEIRFVASSGRVGSYVEVAITGTDGADLVGHDV